MKMTGYCLPPLTSSLLFCRINVFYMLSPQIWSWKYASKTKMCTLECYLIFAGYLKVMPSTSMNKNTNSEILSEFKEGDFIGVNIVLSFYFKEYLNCLCNRIKIIYYAAALSSNIIYFSNWNAYKNVFFLICIEPT